MATQKTSGAISQYSEAPADGNELENYTFLIGQRIKAMRSRRGMIRKDLSRQSGVSERYLAQAETGKANISIAILWRISHALGVEISDLLPESDARAVNTTLLNLVRKLSTDEQEIAFSLLKKQFSSVSPQKKGVALIGLRGAGKSQLGSLLADNFKVPFVRLGEVIEELAQMQIGELISLGGQSAFRRMEKNALDHVSLNHACAIIETGGSLVSQSETFNALLQSYYCVWIKASPEEHMQRVLDQGDMRPMAGNREAMKDLRLILKERETEYRLADYTLDTSGRSIADCITELIQVTTPYLKQETL